MEGVPGLGKTLSVLTLARCLDASFHRIQFTPDLLPADITGTLMELRAKKNVGGLVSGACRSILKGQGIEFLEVREYVPGDDTRSIDWNVTARTGRPFLKRYAEERERAVMLLLDGSASHRLGSGGAWKNETAAELFALLALAAIHNGDAAGMILFAGDVERYVPPARSEAHVLWLIREILAFGAHAPSHRFASRR